MRMEVRYLQQLLLLGLLAALGLLTACVQTPAVEAPESSTVLLVSLQDGSIVKQDIDLDADICMKSNTSSVTTCFYQGDPIVDPDTDQIIGYHMQSEQIDLYGK